MLPCVVTYILAVDAPLQIHRQAAWPWANCLTHLKVILNINPVIPAHIKYIYRRERVEHMYM